MANDRQTPAAPAIGLAALLENERLENERPLTSDELNAARVRAEQQLEDASSAAFVESVEQAGARGVMSRAVFDRWLERRSRADAVVQRERASRAAAAARSKGVAELHAAWIAERQRNPDVSTWKMAESIEADPQLSAGRKARAIYAVLCKLDSRADFNHRGAERPKSR